MDVYIYICRYVTTGGKKEGKKEGRRLRENSSDEEDEGEEEEPRYQGHKGEWSNNNRYIDI